MIVHDTASTEMFQTMIEKFWETIPPVWNSIRGNLRAIVMENYDISVEQFHILRHIRRGIQSVSELAEARQLSRPAISQSVDLLVEKGLIQRQQSTEDRRYVQLMLTDSGNEMINTIFKKNREWMMGKMASLSPDEVSAVIQGMDILKATLYAQSE